MSYSLRFNEFVQTPENIFRPERRRRWLLGKNSGGNDITNCVPYMTR